MTTVIVDQGQNLNDIAIQYAGSVAAIFEIAMANDLSITDDLTPGTSLVIPNVIDQVLVQYFSEKGYVPATALSPEDKQGIKGGISFMGITRNLKVGQ